MRSDFQKSVTAWREGLEFPVGSILSFPLPGDFGTTTAPKIPWPHFPPFLPVLCIPRRNPRDGGRGNAAEEDVGIPGGAGMGQDPGQLWGSRDQSLSCSSAPLARKGSFPNLSPNSCSPGPIERDPGIFPGWGLSLGRCFLPCLRSPG